MALTLEQALYEIDNYRGVKGKERKGPQQGLGDGKVDARDLDLFVGASLANGTAWDKFRKSHHLVANPNIYYALVAYDRNYSAKNDLMITSDDFQGRTFTVAPTPRSNETQNIHGTTVAAPYAWMVGDGLKPKSPEIRGWLAEQDTAARASFAAFPGYEVLRKRFEQLYYIEEIGVPTKRGNLLFYSRKGATQDKKVYCVRNADDMTGSTERVLIDPNELSKKGINISLGNVVPSYDGRLLAYELKPNNADEATMQFMDVATGTIRDGDTLSGIKYAGPQWTPSGDGVYYKYYPKDPSIPVAERPGHAIIRFHKLGNDQAQDVLVYEKTGDPSKFSSPLLSRDGRWLVIGISEGWASRDLYIKDLQKEGSSFELLFKGNKTIAWPTVWKGNIYFETNDGAPKVRIAKSKAGDLDRSHWRTIIPERQDVVIDDMQIIGDRIVLHVMKNAASYLEVYDLEGNIIREVKERMIGEFSRMSGNPDDDVAYFKYESITQPPKIFRTSVTSGERRPWAEIQIPADPSAFVTEQVTYRSKDRTLVTMFLIHKKDMPKDGSTPVLLYGYGGFKSNETPEFTRGWFPYLEAGGAIAIPNLRGGAEYGEDWHRAGMLENKQNVFDDFIAAAEFLVSKRQTANGMEQYTSSDRLAIRGGSNGGLLTGAVLTQRPELYRAVVSEVPLLDMVNYHRYGSGKTWTAEYGSTDDPQQAPWLLAYSPLHNVKLGIGYPATLFCSAEEDDRVAVYHASLMTAALQEASTQPDKILLRVEREAGHGGADKASADARKRAEIASFVMHNIGLTPKPFEPKKAVDKK